MDVRLPVKGTTTVRRFLLLLPVAVLVVAAAVLAGCGDSGGAPDTGTAEAPDTGTGGAPPASDTPAPPSAAESNPPGDIPDNQVFVAYSPAGGGFTVEVPEGWARTTTGASTTFTDKLNRVEVARTSAQAAPTPGSVSSQVVPVLRGQVPHFAPGEVSTVSRHGGQAVLFTYQGDSAPDPVTGKVVRDAFERYAFHRGGVEVDLTLSGPVGADNVDPWRVVTDSFGWR